MRPIQSDEPLTTAALIVEKFEEQSGISLHATNVGQAAVALGLDFLVKAGSQTKFYAEADVALILAVLKLKVDGFPGGIAGAVRSVRDQVKVTSPASEPRQSPEWLSQFHQAVN